MEELDLKELFIVFWSKKLEIFLVTLIAISLGVIYSYIYVVPEYRSSTTLVLAQGASTKDSKVQDSITQSDLNLNSNLVATYSELIKSKSVLRQVATNLEMGEEQLNSIKDKISVKAITNTEVIEITVKDANPNDAAQIANEIAKVFTEKIVDIYNISNIYVIDKAEPTNIPYNINHERDIVVFGLIGIIAGCAIALFINFLDTTVKNEKDVESIEGLIVLTSIPNYNIELKKKGGRRK